MLLKELVQNVKMLSVNGTLDQKIKNVVFDADKVTDGDCFVCLLGKAVNGHLYADIAIANGAKAVVCMQDVICSQVTVIKVADTRKVLSQIAANFYGNPIADMSLVTVVGTNGKTTTAYIIYKMLCEWGYKAGLIGTMYYEYDGKRLASNMTTPDPMELQALFADMNAHGVDFVIMELSAHAIYLNKLYGNVADISVFTNLSQDHLDFFETMENYKNCKKSYFEKRNTRLAVINVDDECGRELLNECNMPTISYGLDNPCDVFAIDEKTTDSGCEYVVNIMDDILRVNSRLCGRFNIYNTLAACVVAKNLGVSDESICSTLQTIEPPDGRFNLLKRDDIRYVIDFAHTPDGLYNLLKECRAMTKGKLITLFGCGGDRDVIKRPKMGRIASEMSDIVVVTSDNPRTEKRMSIANDILSGVKMKGYLYVELDRREAIKLAVGLAQKGDTVVLAGKGSENYIDENNLKTPYSDYAELLKVVEK
ncbi:MAG: UDP-N-acetylmuramoyl-L-alanyl-D-glutamate--2,6-diaminopimelate ligase [Clostridia bacterium]